MSVPSSHYMYTGIGNRTCNNRCKYAPEQQTYKTNEHVGNNSEIELILIMTRCAVFF